MLKHAKKRNSNKISRLILLQSFIENELLTYAFPFSVDFLMYLHVESSNLQNSCRGYINIFSAEERNVFHLEEVKKNLHNLLEHYTISELNISDKSKSIFPFQDFLNPRNIS